jgi:enoyl-CoA hydratase/carnithine racemase
MLFFGYFLKAVGLVLIAVGLANGAGMLVHTMTDASIEAYSVFALPVTLAGLVPGGVLFWLGRRLVRKHRAV